VFRVALNFAGQPVGQQRTIFAGQPASLTEALPVGSGHKNLDRFCLCPKILTNLKKNICWCTSYGLIVLFMHVQLSGNNYLFSCFIIVNIDVKLAQCMKFGQLILRKIIKIVATRCQILRLKCTNFNFG